MRKLITHIKSSITSLRQHRATVLNMNRRNLEYIYPNNARQDFPLADNKLLTKLFLADYDIATAETYQVYSHFFQLRQLEQDLKAYNSFVIKPASGSGGVGILVINSREQNGFLSVGGVFYSLQDIHKHISDILFGIFAFGLNDQAIIEQKIIQHPDLNKLSPMGLADVRLIMHQDQAVQAMIRLATKQSNGTANLHQGAIGVGIDMQSATTSHASYKGKPITRHPDTDIELIGHLIPHWQEFLRTAKQIAKYIPLKYIGIDLAVVENGPCLLEVNVRPGIEIQNANATGIRAILERS